MAGFDVTERPVLYLGPDTTRTVSLTAIASGLTLGAPSTTAAVAPTGVDAAGATGSPATAVVILASGIAAEGGVGTPSMATPMLPDGVAGATTLGYAQVDASILIESISGNEVAGLVIVTQVGDSIAEPEGIATSVVVGDPSITVSVQPASIGSAESIGTAKAQLSILPDGVDANTTALGTPLTAAVVAPDGVASTAGFGDPNIAISVHIVPGPIDPSNDFGNPTVNRKGFVFRPPVNTYRWRLYKEYEGISLLKENGVWSEVAHPDLPRTKSAEVYLAGGRDHVLSTGLKDELVGLGYTVSEEFVTTEEYL